MATNPELSPPDAADTKAAFRKPSNDAANRKYRRHSPAEGSSSSDGSPERNNSSRSKFEKEDSARNNEYHERKRDDERKLNKDSRRSHHSRSDDSYRYSGRHVSRTSRLSRNDDYSRNDKLVEKEEREYHRSSHAGQDSKRDHYSDRGGREAHHSRPRDYTRNLERYHRSKDRERGTSSLDHRNYKDSDPSSYRSETGRRKNYDEIEKDGGDWDRDERGEKRDYHRSRSDRITEKEGSRGQHTDSTTGWDDVGKRAVEDHKSDIKEKEQKLGKEKRNFDDGEIVREKDQCSRGVGKHSDDRTVFDSAQDSPTKKPRWSGSDRDSGFGKDESSSLKQSQGTNGRGNLTEAHVSSKETANDLNAAKFAAMQAAELVNKNLAGGVGTGYLSIEQKKKLLWGSKKSSTAEESGHRWDVSLIADAERQEKFNKLMSLRLPWYIWPLVGCEGRDESRAEIQPPRWRRSSPCRKAEGIAAGSREAIHCWSPKEGWKNSRIGSLRSFICCTCMSRLTYVSMLQFALTLRFHVIFVLCCLKSYLLDRKFLFSYVVMLEQIENLGLICFLHHHCTVNLPDILVTVFWVIHVVDLIIIELAWFSKDPAFLAGRRDFPRMMKQKHSCVRCVQLTRSFYHSYGLSNGETFG